jgi:hypothetical protein
LADPYDAIGLVVLCDAIPCPPAMRELWERQWEESRSVCAARGLALVAPRFESLDSLTAGENLRSARIDTEYLSSGLETQAGQR